MTSPVPGYSVFEVIGHGGYSSVYRARQESVGREVALKVDNRIVRDDRDRRRFLREARAASRLSDHPNVVSVYDGGITDDGRPYLAMELCLAGSLDDRLREHGPRPPAEVRDVGVRIADALVAAHEAGVLHRDLKPANILVTQSGSYGLSDFGLAATHQANQHLSGTVEALTPAYAPPESLRMERPTVAVDVYGLAATLYMLLSGRPPRWPAEGNPSFATIAALHDQPVEPVPGVSAAFNRLLRKALATDPADRYPSAADFRDALADLSATDVTAVEITSETRTVLVVDRPAAAPRRRTNPLVLLLMLALAVIAYGSLVDLPFGAAHEVGDSGGTATTTPPRTDAPGSAGSPVATPPDDRPPAGTTPARSPVGAGPDTITAAGYGPFRIGAATAPLVAAKLARTPVNPTNCDPSGLLLATDPRLGTVYAFKDGDRVDFLAVLDPNHATDDGLRVGIPMDTVTTVADDVQTFQPLDSLRYLVPEGSNGLLFVDDGKGRIGLIVAGPVDRLTSIGEEELRPELCGV
jgi:serine/threonine protein kinase